MCGCMYICMYVCTCACVREYVITLNIALKHRISEWSLPHPRMTLRLLWVFSINAVNIGSQVVWHSE